MNPERKAFIDKIAPIAETVCKGTGLFPSLNIAQACLESNNGQSGLSKLHNNFFGIKANSAWKGGTVTYQTTEYIHGKPVKVPAVFRSYASIEEGFKDRVHFLQVNPRYSLHGTFAAKTPVDQAVCFQKAGYATDPNYANLLSGIIHAYNLTSYDPKVTT